MNYKYPIKNVVSSKIGPFKWNGIYFTHSDQLKKIKKIGNFGVGIRIMKKFKNCRKIMFSSKTKLMK